MCSSVFSAVRTKFVCIFFFVALRPNAGRGLHIHEVSRTQTQRRTTVGRTPLDEWSARRRDLYLTTHNTHKRKASMPPVGFEPTISAVERLQSFVLGRAVTGTGNLCVFFRRKFWKNNGFCTLHLWTRVSSVLPSPHKGGSNWSLNERLLGILLLRVKRPALSPSNTRKVKQSRYRSGVAQRVPGS